MIITMLALIFGLAILVAGLYYLLKEKQDRESRKIYNITAMIGTIIKFIVWGF